MNDYKPAHRPAFGAIAVVLTAMTIALAVVLPAKMNAVSPEVRTEVAPLPVATPAADVDPGPLRIDVIARRDPAWVPVHTRLTTPKSTPHPSGRQGARAVAAPDHLGDAEAGLQRVRCPYLTNGTVEAMS